MIIIIIPLCSAFLLGGLWLLFDGILLCVRAHESKSWEPSAGEIIDTRVETSRDSEGDTHYEIKLLYSYSFNNETYQGDKIFFGYGSTSNMLDNQELVEYFPAGKEVPVYINPVHPDESVLIPGIQRFTLTRAWAGVGVTFIGLWFLVMWYLFGMPTAAYKSIIY